MSTVKNLFSTNKSSLDLSLIDEYFPLDNFRDGQRECIEFILNAFANGKKYVIVEAPTGSGKSVIGYTVSKFFDSAYYITIQKNLQSQIINDFGSDNFVDLKGRNAYPCNFYELYGKNMVKLRVMKESTLNKYLSESPDCNRGYCRRYHNVYKVEQCVNVDGVTCPYYIQVDKALAAHTAVMNFSSFLYQIHMTNRFNERELLIIDESHQTESQLLNFISLDINDKLLNEHGYQLCEYDNPEAYCIDFVDNNVLGTIEAIIESARNQSKLEIVDDYTVLYYKIHTFINEISQGREWVCDYKCVDGVNYVQLKPVFVDTLANKFLLSYGSCVLLMSATILDVDILCTALGIPRNLVAAYRMKSRFPVENRPIYYRPAVKIVGGRAKMHEWRDKLLSGVDEIISMYPNYRGIIHTHNFDIADLLVNGSEFKSRMFYQKNFVTKDQMIEAHKHSKNGIIVAPAMHEGLDLKDDLSRFQILAKTPYPNFIDDKQMTRRIEVDRRLYTLTVALKLVQSYGRSVRSETDWADTYIIDEAFEKFYRDAQSMLPQWFTEAIIW